MSLYDRLWLLRIYKLIEAEASRQDNKTLLLCLGSCDRIFDGGNDWPQAPRLVLYFVDFSLARQHAGLWRFLPARFSGYATTACFSG